MGHGGAYSPEMVALTCFINFYFINSLSVSPSDPSDAQFTAGRWIHATSGGVEALSTTVKTNHMTRAAAAAFTHTRSRLLSDICKVEEVEEEDKCSEQPLGDNSQDQFHNLVTKSRCYCYFLHIRRHHPQKASNVCLLLLPWRSQWRHTIRVLLTLRTFKIPQELFLWTGHLFNTKSNATTPASVHIATGSNASGPVVGEVIDLFTTWTCKSCGNGSHSLREFGVFRHFGLK